MNALIHTAHVNEGQSRPEFGATADDSEKLESVQVCKILCKVLMIDLDALIQF